MKRVLVALAGPLVVVGLVACGDDGFTPSGTTYTATPAPPPAPIGPAGPGAPSPGDQDGPAAPARPGPPPPPFSEVDPATSDFFADLDGTDILDTETEEALYNQAVDSCRALDRGATPLAVLAGLIVAQDYSVDDAQVFLTAAAGDLCTQHKGRVAPFADLDTAENRRLVAEACKLDPAFSSDC